MPILYTVIARGTTVLVKYESVVGNFTEVTEQILAKIPPDDSKFTYSHTNYLFNYIKEQGITYLCITDDEFERARAFHFLGYLKQRFETTYGKSRILEALPFAMNSDFSPVLAGEMKRFSEARDIDNLTRVEGELGELKEIMVKNIDNLASRGERLELLINKTEHLHTTSVSFQKTSNSLARAMRWRNLKFWIYLITGVIVVIYVIVSFSCGGPTWSGCLTESSTNTSNIP